MSRLHPWSYFVCVLSFFAVLAGCGPSARDVLAAFERQAASWGIRYDAHGNLNAVKMNRVRVDGVKRTDVWRINYDVPAGNGKSFWCTAHVTFDNGRLTLIRTDREGVVDSHGQIQSLDIDPLKYNRK